MWGRNVRAVVATETWVALRWGLGAMRFRPRFLTIDFPDRRWSATLHCAYCDAEHETLELHEEWEYDDGRRVQRLVGLKPVCAECHLATHLGYATVIGHTDEALAHLAKVNRWSAKQAKTHRTRAFAAWELRASTVYALDVSYLLQYLPPTKIHMNWLDNPRTWVGSRLDAIVWARRLLDSDAVIVDTETTGLLEKSNVEVIELAAIDMKGKPVYQGLFKPRYKIPTSAIKIHGITNEEVKPCRTFAEQSDAVIAALHGKTIVTYNVRFDREVVKRTCTMHKVEDISARWECAMLAYRTFARSGQCLKLPYGSHRALADCRATLRLIRKMARAPI